MKIEKINYTGIRVRDAKKATEFLGDLIGSPFPEIAEVEEHDVKMSIHPIGIEIIEPLSADGAPARALKSRGEGLSHICLKVANLEEAIAEMKARDVRLIARLEGSAIFHPADTFGVMIEFSDHDLTSR